MKGTMSQLDSTQQGTAAELLFMVHLILGGGGLVEVMKPMTDDERKDVETHLRRQFKPGLLWQVKSTTHVDDRFKAPRLSIHFPVAKDRLLSNARYWYFFAYLDVSAMGFANPAFLVPSEEVHRHASPKLVGDTWSFNFGASLDPNANDYWSKFQHSPRDVGGFVRDLLMNQKLAGAPSVVALPAFDVPDGALFVNPREILARPLSPGN
jgi:hypothetical protein